MNIITTHRIKEITGRQIFDSRAMPTIEARVTLEDGTVGIASVPSGASRGRYEAYELRDGMPQYRGNSVFNAIKGINTEIDRALRQKDAGDTYEIDSVMKKLDGSENKSVLGANAILAVSLACAHAAATSYGTELFRFIGGVNARALPVPMMNILNGGAHASNNLDIQEFMIVPSGATSFADAMRIGTDIYASLRSLLKTDGLQVSVGDEGGFAPMLKDDEEAIKYIVNAIEVAGYIPGEDAFVALDVAASEWYDNGDYRMPKNGIMMTADELHSYYLGLIVKYPIISIEDPFGEDDLDAFAKFTEAACKTQIVGDDLFVTNPSRLRKGIKRGAANAILVKPNQIGSLSETLDTVAIASENGYNTILSHRSGDTDDTSIADIAVATNAGQIKTGAPARGERVSKYNRLLRIEEILGESAVYGTFS